MYSLAAAWTAVDNAEDEDKQAIVHAINAGGTENLAKMAKELNCKMVYISTDYVFDGPPSHGSQIVRITHL